MKWPSQVVTAQFSPLLKEARTFIYSNQLQTPYFWKLLYANHPLDADRIKQAPTFGLQSGGKRITVTDL